MPMYRATTPRRVVRQLRSHRPLYSSRRRWEVVPPPLSVAIAIEALRAQTCAHLVGKIERLFLLVVALGVGRAVR